MRSIDKRTLDEAIRLSRKYWKTGDADILLARTLKARELSYQYCGDEGVRRSDFLDCIDAALLLVPNCTNATIYSVFETMGIKILKEAKNND